MKRVLVLAIIFLALGCTGQPNIEVTDVTAIPSGMVVDAVSFFMLIDNTGDANDALVSASIQEHPYTKVELHDVIDGQMRPVEKIDIPAGEVTVLKSGSYHIMALDVPEPSGDLNLVLDFEKSGQMTVKAPVMGFSGSMDMGSKGDMTMRMPAEGSNDTGEMVVVGCG